MLPGACALVFAMEDVTLCDFRTADAYAVMAVWDAKKVTSILPSGAAGNIAGSIQVQLGRLCGPELALLID